MPLRSILESGELSKHLKGKSCLKRIKSMVINAVARPQFGGIVLQDLPGAFWISLVYICFFFAVFVTLFIRTTTSDQNLPFISLNNGQSGVTCKPVNKQIRGDFAACYASDPAFGGSAKWETKSGFMSSKSIFRVSFSGEDISSAAYYAAMDDFALKAERLTTLSDQRPLFWNILLLTCLGFSSQDGNVKLTLSTDASFTFTSVVRIALFSSRHGACIGEANSSAPTYLGGRFEEARGSISLRIPIKKPNATSILGTTRASGDSLKFLLSQKQPEPCPRHGSWAQTVINPTMYSDYRYGYGTIEFDVRSALLAIALNLNLVGTDSLTQVRSVVSDKLGLVGFLDPYYSYPPMARFYCIDKTSDVWSSSFSEEEKQDQKNSFAASDSAVRYKYPNICFLVSTTKTATIMLYYPIFSMLDTKGNMCSCGPSGNAENVDCNRHKLYTAFLYDRNSVSGMFDQSPDSKMTALDIKRDVMVTWAIGMQQFLVESMGTISADEYIGWGWSNHDADIDFLNLFTKIFWNANLFQSRPAFSSASSEFSANQAKAWDDICAVAKSNPSDCSNRLAAVVFRSDGVVGSNQFTNPINSFNVQVADLVPDQSKTYLERATGTPQIASSCQSPFVKIIQATRDLKLTPPLNLEESYYQCTKDFQTFMIVAVGSVYSSTNLIATLCWIGMGFVFIKITKKLDLSKATLMGKHGKEVLRDIHEEMKDLYLVQTIEQMRERIRALEARPLDRPLDDKTFKMFKELHFDEKDEKNLQDPLRKEEKRKVGLEIVEELSERLKEYEKEEIETLKDAIHRLSTREPKGMLKDTIRRSTKPSKFEEHDQEQAAGLEMQEQERRAYQDSPKGDHGARLGGHGRGRGRGHGVYDNDDDVGGEEHKDEAGFYGVAERHAPTMPVSYNPQHQHHHQQQQQQQPNGNPAAFDAKVVASNLRRLSVLLQRGGMAGVGGAEAVSMGETGTQAPQLQRHPMATVLSGMTPPAPADTGRRQSVRK